MLDTYMHTYTVYTLYYDTQRMWRIKRKTQQEELLPLQIYFTLKSLLSVEIKIVNVVVFFLIYLNIVFLVNSIVCAVLFQSVSFVCLFFSLFLFIPSLIQFLVGKCWIRKLKFTCGIISLWSIVEVLNISWYDCGYPQA